LSNRYRGTAAERDLRKLRYFLAVASSEAVEAEGAIAVEHTAPEVARTAPAQGGRGGVGALAPLARRTWSHGSWRLRQSG
jgi:hypothetical protein